MIIGITWGGVQSPWSSGEVLAPLVAGAVAMVAFFVYEFIFAKNPLVRLALGIALLSLMMPANHRCRR